MPQLNVWPSGPGRIMHFDQIRGFLEAEHQPAYRWGQLKRAFYIDLVSGWDEVTVFPKPLREACKAAYPWTSLEVVRTQKDRLGETVKTLFRCHDGATIEAVLMSHHEERNTVCVSSQVGCAMACAFCATGTMGWKRNLTAEEMVDQVLHYARTLTSSNERVTNVVFMGMGEPFHNYDEVMRAIRMLNDGDGFGLGARHISISTCGIVPGILRLADEGIQVNLAISLHGATDLVRGKIMPVNKAYPLKKLMSAVHTYMEKTNRRVMFEYLLLRGINDRPEDARALADLLGPDYRLVHVNLIKYHNTEAFVGTDHKDRLSFLDRLHMLHIPATHRVTFGEDIDAACGQLAVKEDGGSLKQGREAIRASKSRAKSV